MTELTPTRTWQALVPELPSFTVDSDAETGALPTAVAAHPADTAERLLLLLHYSIDWDNSWIGEPKYRKTYWDEILPSRVRRAAYRATTLDEWWSSPALVRLGAATPRYADRRLELAGLLREPSLPVLTALHTSLPALLLRVRIIAEAVAAKRKTARN
ncbi:hypothetical protein [Mycobacterium paragordonae]|uniref:Uncharacterized protein n=1 Tax=Mycobacterium paragordonae TaxID=1389713 RepID=A0AAJ1SAJ9_9MYCO|nr:hypothetical protein [Mycobacterium paragordonae]MDP7739207.1 hypothetical protein [Mycobacterium paragordonae]TDL03998.1 hypothetical protein EUA05_22295 [Mycobacterium paragordonae]